MGPDRLETPQSTETGNRLQRKVEATFLKDISRAVYPVMLHIWFSKHVPSGNLPESLTTPLFFCCGILGEPTT